MLQLPISRVRQLRLSAALSLAFRVLFLALYVNCAEAQNDLRIPVEGYITAVTGPNSFDVNKRHVNYQPNTPFGIIEGDRPTQNSSLRDRVHVGAYVEVKGRFNKHTKATDASAIYLFNDWDQKLSGLAVIDKVLHDGSTPLYRADGYPIRITSATDLTFSEELNSSADVHTNTWLRYEGKLDAEGVLIATRATFLPARPARSKSLLGQDEDPSQGLLPGSSRHNPDPAQTPGGKSFKAEINPKTLNRIDFEKTLDAEGNLKEDAGIRWGVMHGWHTIPADRVLQERVRRIGQRLVPAYQKELPDDNPSKIHFRFYVLDERYHSEVCPLSGLVLIPKLVIERLENDDQLAAVIADGIAYNLQRQAARVNSDNRLLLSAYTAMAFVPALLFLPALDGAISTANKINVALMEQRSRVSLALMSDAGYDLQQAPEAWRLLAPKHMPKDKDTLDYPDISGYQFSIIHQQYSQKSSMAETAPLQR